ncbi:MAG: hypothetical protein CSA83_01340 [Actinomycetales bacterium]|nr:MAG: hypothetical protein CSA83_01340 [Actinomycetales bacterium]
MFVAVGNAGYFGGGMRILPKYDLTDGLLDVTIIHPVSRATLMRLLPSVYSGTFIKDPAAELIRAKTVEIDGSGLFAMADGEELGELPMTVRSAPRALNICVPVSRVSK